MKQCRLVRGNHIQICWLPVKFAISGRYVRLFDQDGWLVERVFQLYQAEPSVPHGYFAGGVFHNQLVRA